MKNTLRILALLIVAVALAWWLAAGLNRGWTKTRVPVKKLDEVTGIEGIEYQKRLVPGLDFLAGALLGSGVLAGVSLLLRTKPIKTETTP